MQQLATAVSVLAFEHNEIESTLGERIRMIAQTIPTNIAIRTEDQAISYAAFDAASDCVAAAILAHPAATTETVAVLMEEGIQSLTALFGIFKAGKCSVLIPPQLPPQRKALIWEHALQPILLTNQLYLAEARQVVGKAEWVVNLDELTADAADTQPHLAVPMMPESAAVLLYTSGSTGEPKGVVCPHKLLLHSSWYEHHFHHITEASRWLVISSYFYGSGMSKVLAALANGATLYLRPALQSSVADLEGIIQWLADEAITALALPPSLLIEWLEQLPQPLTLPDLQLVFVGGQALYRRNVEKFRRLFPRHTRLLQRLSSSESKVLAEFWIDADTPVEWEVAPYGRPVPDKEILLLDEEFQRVPDGEIGQIAVRSDYLALGYWRQPELTAAKFRPDPDGGARRVYLMGDTGRILPNGMLEMVGRLDNMVKVRGFRVQLEEIDATLLALPNLANAVTGAHTLPSGEKRLVAYVVPKPGRAVTFSELRQTLAQKLPDYMVPTAMVTMATLPQTVTGKVDRQALPAPSSMRPLLQSPFVAPQSALEQAICALWSALLEVEEVGVQDDFFELGGTSLLAMRMAAQVEAQFQQAVPARFFTKPTVSFLIRCFEEERAPDSDPNAIDTTNSVMRYKNFRAGPLLNPNRALGEQLRGEIRKKLERAALRMDYRLARRWLRQLCQQEAVIRTLYKAEAEDFREMAAGLGHDAGAIARLLPAYLVNNVLHTLVGWATIGPKASHDPKVKGLWYRMGQDLRRRVETYDPDDAAALVRFTGLSHLTASLQRGRGVLLATYHSPMMRFAVFTFVRYLQLDNYMTLSGGRAEEWHHQMKMDATLGDLPESTLAYVASVTHHAQKVLQNGGLVQIANDYGYSEQGTLPFAVGGRRYQFKSGIAELALATGADLICYQSALQADGTIHTTFQPPIVPLLGRGTHAQQVSHMVGEYAAFLESCMQATPEAVTWQGLRHYLSRPVV